MAFTHRKFRSEDPSIKNVFILGYDEKHQQDIEHIVNDGSIRTHALLHSDQLINQDHYDIDDLLEQARAVLDTYDSVDGIVCHWDFPVTSMHSILCAEYGLPAPSLTSLLKCAHKYWSRIEQQKSVPENTPYFCAVDPFDDDALENITLNFPFWMKPITGYGSVLGFHIKDEQDFHAAIREVRKKIKNVGDPFSDILSRVDIPEELRGIDGNYMLAEQYITGREFAPEGYMQNGKCHVHAMIDMIFGPNGKSFERYQFPSTVPKTIQIRAAAITEKLMTHMGFNNGCFNIEFFWDPDTDELWIIEINPRISQSHSYLFEKVKGLSNHEIAIKVALGEPPHFEGSRGDYQCAAKFLHRLYDRENRIATRVPEQTDIEALQKQQPDTLVYPRLRKGMELAKMKEQDSYSYVIADVLIAAHNEPELEKKYQQAAEILPFEFKPLRRDRQERTAKAGVEHAN